MMNSIDPTNDNLSEDSFLDSMRKPPPMAAPEGYFASFGDRLQQRLEEEVLQEEAPTLFGMPRKTPFIIPQGYFDQLGASIKAGISQNGSGRIRPMFLTLYASAAAAVIVMLMMWKGSAPASQTYPGLPEMSASELLAVVDIEEDLIIESFLSEDLTSLVEDIPFPVEKPQSTPDEDRSPEEALSFDELLEGLEELDDESLDALEAELLEMEDSDWYE